MRNRNIFISSLSWAKKRLLMTAENSQRKERERNSKFWFIDSSFIDNNFGGELAEKNSVEVPRSNWNGFAEFELLVIEAYFENFYGLRNSVSKNQNDCLLWQIAGKIKWLVWLRFPYHFKNREISQKSQIILKFG